MMENNQIPTYVMPMLSRQAASFAISTNHGVQTTPHREDTTSDSDNECDDLDNSDTLIQHSDQSQSTTSEENHQPSVTTTTDGIIGISTEKFNNYSNFIQRSQEDFLQNEKAENQKTSNSFTTEHNSSTTHEKVNNYEARVLQLAVDVNKLTPGQRNAYDKAVNRINSNMQLIMFISGEGGTGKTFVIAVIQEYTRLRFGKQIGLYGATVAMAPTGCAANVVRGYTWQACYGKGRSQDKTGNNKMSSLTAKKIGAKFDGTKLLVLDEVSMINFESLAEMSDRHIEAVISLTEDKEEQERIKSRPFGGVHVLFTGDLWQLKAIGGHPVISTSALSGKALQGRKIWHSINEYSELTENYRFKNDVTTIFFYVELE
jgi:PIF1-like helicase